MESSGERCETHSSSGRDSDQLHTEARHAQPVLCALEALLRAGHDDDPFAIVFAALHDVFAFDQVLVLAETKADSVHCIAAVPKELVGLGWTAARSPEQAADPASAIPSHHELDDWWKLPRDLISPSKPTLCLPFGMRDRQGLLILLRAEGKQDFDPDHVAMGQEFSLLAAAALAVRDSKKLETESRLLRDLADELRQSGQKAQRNSDLLKGIMDLLPIGLTVQNESGRFILVNSAAAINSRLRTDAPAEASPADILSDDQAAKRRDREVDALTTGKLVIAEEKVGPTG